MTKIAQAARGNHQCAIVACDTDGVSKDFVPRPGGGGGWVENEQEGSRT